MCAEELDAHRKRVQAQHPGLTLTGMYNVLEKLRAAAATSPGGPEVTDAPGRASLSSARRGEGQEPSGSRSDSRRGAVGTPRPTTPVPSSAPLALTPKEKQIHEQGLVSVLKQLHDDLDAAVLAAYGWPSTLT